MKITGSDGPQPRPKPHLLDWKRCTSQAGANSATCSMLFWTGIRPLYETILVPFWSASCIFSQHADTTAG